jgi:hypothetical protein
MCLFTKEGVPCAYSFYSSRFQGDLGPMLLFFYIFAEILDEELAESTDIYAEKKS